MYALIRQYNGLDTKTQETATRKANAELRPILATSPGFVSFELIKPEDKNNVVASITVFKTERTPMRPARSPRTGFRRTGLR